MSHSFPTIDEILAMHADLIAQFGGSPGLRDMGALESAITRPQMGYYGSLLEEAAALMESLAMNHPFVDGNKRVAFFVTDAFLRLNGRFIDCDDRAAYQDFMRLFETNAFRFAELRKWLEAHVAPLPLA
jgi:death-on-curing protein